MREKVLFTASTASHILHFHLPYLRAFQDKGWMVHVACGGQEADIPCAHEAISLPLEKKMTAPGNFRAASILRKKIQAEHYALIITHTTLAAFFTRLAVKGLKERPKVVNVVHGYLFDDDSSFLKRQILLSAERFTAGETDLLLAMNRYDLETARRFRLASHVDYIPGIGVDFEALDVGNKAEGTKLREWLGLGEDRFVLIYPAEFSKRKSQETLIRAMERLPDYVTLILPGEGTLRPQCQTLADTLGLSHRVIFPGYITDMGTWYAMADAAISASRSEGLPFNVMEAMYAGLPVVASAVKGHEDLVEDGESGLLYPYGDWGACAARVRELLDSPVLQERLSRTAKARVAAYALEEVFPRVMAQYESLYPAKQEKIPAHSGT